jgi:Cyclin, N-terminal domain
LNKDISLWSIAILSLAAKYIELDDNVPRISELKEIVESKVYSRTIFVKCEKYLLRVLDWNLVVITPLHFASCILNY